MQGLPWFLLAAGILLLILGTFLGVLMNAGGDGPRMIHPSMRDEDIARRLKESGGSILPGLVILAGAACILVSLAWRLLRMIL